MFSPTETGTFSQVDLGAPVSRLFTPSSGAFFAQTNQALMRSDDAGATWVPVSLPGSSHILAIDPTNHQVLYAAGPDGVYVSRDDATSWNRVLAYGPAVGFDARALVVSPADPNVLYLGIAGSGEPSKDFWFLRSRDGGATWESLEEHHNSMCGWVVDILQAHPSDPNTVFRCAGCRAGRNIDDTIMRSTDQGTTWTPWPGVSSPNPDPGAFGFPARFSGGQGAAPDVFYLGINRDARVGGSLLVRTGDAGATSNVVLDFRGGGSPGYNLPDSDPNAASTQIGGLAYDPAQPDRVFVGLAIRPAFGSPPADGSVMASLDGGASWATVGGQTIGAVNDLALGVDAQNLYAATDAGVWRLAL
ncbi:MAG TPA: hypothetical protein VKV73_19060 [Chloroflexota bacterium]|nr:hypothetical protein [Chloroflexota bacterium]